MIEFRKNSHCLTKGEYKLISSKKDVFVFERSFENEKLLIVANMTNKERPFNVNNDVLISNYSDKISYLRPYEAYIVEVK